jgi:alpha-tubulin suppressor-like RCC1 family protein
MIVPRGVPTIVDFFKDKQPEQIRVGLRHSAVITSDGSLYMYGSGNYGILGQGNEQDVRWHEPIEVTFFKDYDLKLKDI